MVCICCFSQLMCEPYDFHVLSTSTVIPGCQRGTFRTPQELDNYEKLWHTCIYQPSWSELEEKVNIIDMLVNWYNYVCCLE